MLSDKTLQDIMALIQRYPRPRSALIPSLQLAQAEMGCLSADTIREIAQIFAIAPIEVDEVVSFYAMLFKKPAGKYVLQVCTNIACLLSNSEEIMAHLEKRLGVKPGETTPDQRFTLMEVECLGSCGTAPVVQINEEYHENMTPEKLDQILDTLD